MKFLPLDVNNNELISQSFEDIICPKTKKNLIFIADLTFSIEIEYKDLFPLFKTSF